MNFLAAALLLGALSAPLALRAQSAAPSIPQPAPANPATAPALGAFGKTSQSPFTFTPMKLPHLSAGVLELLKLEGEFSADVASGGGKAFSSWFADDGVTLNNGQPALQGRTAIAAAANWNPANYRLSWYAEGAQMDPSNQTGFTWGHYDATTIGKDGKSTTTSGRYITFWRKEHGKWKVALDASADEPPPTNGMPTP